MVEKALAANGFCKPARGCGWTDKLNDRSGTTVAPSHRLSRVMIRMVLRGFFSPVDATRRDREVIGADDKRMVVNLLSMLYCIINHYHYFCAVQCVIDEGSKRLTTKSARMDDVRLTMFLKIKESMERILF